MDCQLLMSHACPDLDSACLGVKIADLGQIWVLDKQYLVHMVVEKVVVAEATNV